MLSHWQICVCIKPLLRIKSFMRWGCFLKIPASWVTSKNYFLWVPCLLKNELFFILILKVHKQTKTLKFFQNTLAWAQRQPPTFHLDQALRKKFFTEHSACGKKPKTTRIGGKLIKKKFFCFSPKSPAQMGSLSVKNLSLNPHAWASLMLFDA